MNASRSNNPTRRRDASPGCCLFQATRRWAKIAWVRTVIAGTLLMALSGCNWVFYYPDAKIRGTPKDHDLDFEDVHFAASDGTQLHGWFLPAKSKPALGTVLHLHGNAANITGHYEFVHWLPDRGYNVLVFDYRGFGQSGGLITREGTLADSLAALDYLRTRRDVDTGKIVLFGQSLGGVLGLNVAAARSGQVRAAAIDSAFSSYREIVRHHVTAKPVLTVFAWWYPFMVPEGDDAIDAARRLRSTPVFYLHGKADAVVPWSMSQALYDATHGVKDLWLIDGLDHTEVWVARRDEARDKLTAFYEAALSGRPRPDRPASDRAKPDSLSPSHSTEPPMPMTSPAPRTTTRPTSAQPPANRPTAARPPDTRSNTTPSPDARSDTAPSPAHRPTVSQPPAMSPTTSQPPATPPTTSQPSASRPTASRSQKSHPATTRPAKPRPSTRRQGGTNPRRR